ncbi:hypothetical protein CRUP_037993 [Coryphaenoides rupestris]|nr:hypothetical protein CRUP_037993 [Coryphaenoides rupestris]
MCNSKQLVALTGPQCDRHHNSLSGQKRSVAAGLNVFRQPGGASITAAATFSSSCCCSSSSFRAWAAARCSSSSCSRRRRALAFFSCSA